MEQSNLRLVITNVYCLLCTHCCCYYCFILRYIRFNITQNIISKLLFFIFFKYLICLVPISANCFNCSAASIAKMRDNFKFNAGYLFFRIIQNQRDISFTYNKENKCIDYLVDSFVGYTVHLLLE